jgi:hypothetical protein
VLKHVVFHRWLQHSLAGRRSDLRQELRSLDFGKQIIQANVRGLRRSVNSLPLPDVESFWIGYAGDKNYSAEDQQKKDNFLRAAVAAQRRSLTWDIGCNTGNYSKIAAENSDSVLALDSDELCIDSLYRSLKQQGPKNILPLVYNPADPSPALGWRGSERRTLEQRGTPELILCLALLHHLCFSSNLPLAEVVDWLAGFRCDLLIEFVDREDSNAQRLLRNKDMASFEYDRTLFEQLLGRAYDVADRLELAGGLRTLYFCRIRR